MRLSEIEEAIISGKCTPELLEQFKAALRRAPKSMRPQHCFTTAAAMPVKCFSQAKELIEFSLTLEGDWLDRMRAHHNLADLFEKQGNYADAKTHYQLALDAVAPARQSDYAPDYAAHMLVCQLHLDSFTYSDDLRRLFEQSREDDDFRLSFQKPMFYRTLAKIILFLQEGRIDAAQAAYDQACAMLRPDYEGPLTALLRRKNYVESTGATKEARAFLRRIKNHLR